MITVHEQFVVDSDGHKRSVVLPIEEWEKIVSELEELEDIRAYDQAKQEGSSPVPFEKAVREIRGDDTD
ncbi:MAG TPA: hypothetical protein VKA64_05890 [Gammaproteobacteria bacterium]|nr:hypothetical protein [Gammaproteobacteria bacterium]